MQQQEKAHLAGAIPAAPGTAAYMAAASAGAHRAHDIAFYKAQGSSGGGKSSAAGSMPKPQEASYSWVQRLARSEPGAGLGLGFSAGAGQGSGLNNGSIKTARNSASSGWQSLP
ncbi:hypothetical protein OEZ85_004421 [Tetradesmus obliquus]|uniref:Uncharacterized protein n=1 Tax=Tetradesmus obliquus TaxID=3088 RepID=A0ABY8UKP0_TETOB|nr:hypothetical protein OEZ85_004421 [Tetradesmus obliquus]